jgi:hypothetical protein
MFCPECKAEYRQGFTRCADCDVDLVYELAGEASGAPPNIGEARETDLQVIWKGDIQDSCVILCRQLMKTQISYKVAQIPESRTADVRVKRRYEISVPKADYQRAKDLLGFEGEFEDTTSNDDEEDDTEVLGAVSLPPDDSAPDEEVRNDSYLKPWYPEDATLEIWSQNGEDFSWGIEMALKESLIHCRSDLEDGVRKVFVLPEDEMRARRVVREVTEGIELE